jgi:hypothetical protein
MPAIGRDEADAGYAKWSATIGVEA